jgi:hypothetical protein
VVLRHMTVELRVRLDSGVQLEDLREWMGGLPGVRVRAVPRPPDPNSQGTVWDFLSLACATGGPLVAGVRALQMWAQARVVTIQVEVGDRKFTVTGHNARAVLPEVTAAAEALAAAGTAPDGTQPGGTAPGGTQPQDGAAVPVPQDGPRPSLRPAPAAEAPDELA